MHLALSRPSIFSQVPMSLGGGGRGVVTRPCGPDYVPQACLGVPILLGWSECPPNPRVCCCPWF